MCLFVWYKCVCLVCLCDFVWLFVGILFAVFVFVLFGLLFFFRVVSLPDRPTDQKDNWNCLIVSGRTSERLISLLLCD